VAEPLDETGRIQVRNGDERSFRGDKAVGDRTVQMQMKAAGIIAAGLQGGDPAGDGATIAGGIPEELLDRSAEALSSKGRAACGRT
jgi:hypothetical protein